MIIIKLKGGLGNQMFQYALGKHLAIKNRVVLKLDISDFEHQDLRNYELDKFNIKEELISGEKLYNILYPYAKNIFSRILNKVSGNFFGYQKIIEKDFLYNKDVLNTNKKSYLNGYWQSEKYFKAIEPLIRSTFNFEKIENLEYLKEVRTNNSVSIHIRRGDYVSNLHTNQVHGTCPPEYYYKCMNYMSDKIKNPFFYLFSDDIDWVKQHLKINSDHAFVSDNIMDNYSEMYMMSLCKHNIIANSSFSWWSAWLNNNPEKIIVAPAQWFADKELNSQTKDFIPEKWIRI